MKRLEIKPIKKATKGMVLIVKKPRLIAGVLTICMLFATSTASFAADTATTTTEEAKTTAAIRHKPRVKPANTVGQSSTNKVKPAPKAKPAVGLSSTHKVKPAKTIGLSSAKIAKENGKPKTPLTDVQKAELEAKREAMKQKMASLTDVEKAALKQQMKQQRQSIANATTAAAV